MLTFTKKILLVGLPKVLIVLSVALLGVQSLYYEAELDRQSARIQKLEKKVYEND